MYATGILSRSPGSMQCGVVVPMSTMWSCCPNVHNVELLSQCSQCGVVVPMFTMWSCCPNVHNVELLSQCSQCGVVVPMSTMWSCCPNVHNVELLSQCPQCGVHLCTHYSPSDKMFRNTHHPVISSGLITYWLSQSHADAGESYVN